MRHVMALLMFLGTTISYATRVSMSVAIVAMTSNNTYGYPVISMSVAIVAMTSNNTYGYPVSVRCARYCTTISYATRVSMSVAIVAMTSNNTYGYPIPAGMIAGRFGGKYLMFTAMACTGAVNLLVPFAAVKGDWIAVCACRVLMGLTQGLLYPSIHGVLGHWAPTAERSRLGTFVYAVSTECWGTRPPRLSAVDWAPSCMQVRLQGDWIAVCACRVLMGLTQGLLYPSIHGVLGHWAPTAERSRLGTFVYAGKDWIAVCACRVLMGLTQGLLYPSIHGVLGHWAPTAERSRLGTFVYAGLDGAVLQARGTGSPTLASDGPVIVT
ncbi:Permease of the major facilitator superfamily [Operophtera brumata]|uniref:Permease of the major facilitator superfamily n=1 Tax=Operophtera brumata TaxID=104452 RepID=A0A0L7KX49_OPEBR|nr:Permease of the major facilitator superfamily [Operophtera brumata]